MMMWLTGREKDSDDVLAVSIQHTSVTDRRTDTGRRLYRIASRGKNR